MTIGDAVDDEAMDCFLFPAAVDELCRQPIEKLGVGWFGAVFTEVIGGGDEACAEMILPESIDRDASGEWVFRVRHPFRQLHAALRFGCVGLEVEAVGGGSVWSETEGGEASGGDDITRFIEIAPGEDVKELGLSRSDSVGGAAGGELLEEAMGAEVALDGQ